VAQCTVGFQPDGLDMANGKIYVANSGGYLYPDFEKTVSVIDVYTFQEIKRIEVAVNPNRICTDKNGNIWVNTLGDYAAVPSKLYCIDSKTDQVTDSINIAVSNFCLDDDKLYTIAMAWSNVTMSNEITYGIVDVVSKQIIAQKIITDGTDKEIATPYGIAVHPFTKDIYITDAKNYVLPGALYCFDKYGKKKWDLRTGDIPGHFAFLCEHQ
jgi:YVTN family beta-propeller protein